MATMPTRLRLQRRESWDVAPLSPSARHPGDAVRVGLGLAVLAVALLAVQRDHLTLFERDLFRLVNNLPGVLAPFLVIVMQGGNFVAGPVAAATALGARARRMAIDLAVAGPVAWFAAKAVKSLVERPRPGGFLDDVLRYGPSDGMGFVSGHTAVAAALATAACPYLGRRWRRAAWCGVWLVGTARIYEGAHLPLDVVGGAAVGWAIGATLHLAFGAPHRMPSLADARDVLVGAGLDVTSVRRVAGTPKGSFPFVAELTDEPVFVKLLDPEPRDRDWLFRIARFLAFRDVRDEVALVDPPAQADHEAAMTLLARSVGCRAPVVRGIERSGARTWLIEEVIPGCNLGQLPVDQIDDALLGDLWVQVAALRAARLAHRDLVPANIVVDDDCRVWLVDFAHAESAAPDRALDNDVAELLAATAQLVGPERAVAPAAAALGRQALTRALPELQPLALTATTRRALGHSDVLDRLRLAVATVADHETTPATEVPPTRVSSVMRPAVAAATGLTALVVLAGPASVWRELMSVSLRWAGLAGVIAAVGAVASAAALIAAASRRLALGRTLVVQLAASTSSVRSRQGDREVLAAYLGRVGVSAADALLALGRVTAARRVAGSVTALAAVAGAWEASAEVRMLHGGVAVTVIALAAAVWRRRRPRPLGASWSVASAPTGAVLLGSSVTATMAEALCLVAAVKATGSAPAVAAVILVQVVAAAIAVIVTGGPAPGLAEALLVAGLFVAGVPLAAAVAAVLVSRTFTFWVPVSGGVGVWRLLSHRQVV